MDNNNDVAIIGIGIRLPGSESPGKLWSNLNNNFNGVVDATKGEYPRWSKNKSILGDIKTNKCGLVDIKHWRDFDPLFFGMTPNDVPLIDPQQRLLLKCTWEAIEESMIDPVSLRGTNTSVFIGCTSIDYQTNLYNEWDVQQNNFASNFHSISNRISYCFDFRGASLTVDTACSSSGNAIHLGYRSIVDGSSDYSIVGGTNFICESVNSGQTKTETYLNMLGASGRCNAFDAAGDGFVRAEGCGVFLLKRLSKAIEDGDSIYCVIKGTSSNEDGSFNKPNFFAPSKDSQCKNIKLALKQANLDGDNVHYIEAHGTGTPVGDPIEAEAISMALSKNRTDGVLLLGSIKSNIGHLEAASGVASLAKCCLMFKHREFVSNHGFKNPNPNIKFDEWKLKVVTEKIPFPSNNNGKNPIIMAINNFGITGSNSCLLLSEYIEVVNQPIQTAAISPSLPIKTNLLIPFSANSKKSLDKYRLELIESLKNGKLENQISFNEFVKYQCFSKSQFYQRSVISASNWGQLKVENQLISTSNDKSFNMISNPKNTPIVFVFSGQGPQYIKMGLDLYQNNEVFKNSMDMVDDALRKHFGYSNLEKLRSISSNDKTSIHLPIIAQPCIFIIQVSLFNLFKHWGIKPSIIIGHSFGEVTAAFCSNMISFETSCYLVYKRALLQNETVGSGRMLSVGISFLDFENNYKSQYPDLEISCFNSPSSIVLGGNENNLNNISDLFKRKGIFNAFLGSNASFHTTSQKSIKKEMMSVGNFESNSPNVPTFSSVSGNLFNAETQPFNTCYLYKNIRKAVNFELSIKNIIQYVEDHNLGTSLMFLELSPHPTLGFYIKQMIPKDSSYFSNRGNESISVVTTLNKNKNDIDEINKSISQIYCNGYNDVGFKSQFSAPSNSYRSINNHLLPTYQFDEVSYWKESELSISSRTNGPSIDTLGIQNPDSLFKSMTSYININTKPYSYLKGHQVSNKCYFPGTGYIDNLIKLFPTQDFNIQYLEFKVPFILSENEIGILHTNLFQTSKSEYRSNFSIKDNRSKQWIQSSTGKLQLLTTFENQSSNKIMNIEQLKSNCNYTKPLSSSEVYEHIKAKTGLHYNGAFKRVEECMFGDGCVLTKVSLNSTEFTMNTIQDDNEVCSFFNPSVLDCCLHGSILLNNDEYSQLVFDRVEDYKVYSSNIATAAANQKDEMITHVYAYIKSKGRIGDSYYSSATIMLPNGTMLIQVEKLVLTSVIPIVDQLKIENPNEQLYSFYLQNKDSPLPKPRDIISITTNNGNSLLNINSIIKECLIPNLNEKMVFRILDFTNNQYHQSLIINEINELLTIHNEIDIEYTITLNDTLKMKEIKENLPNFKSSLLFKEFNNKTQIEFTDKQIGFKPSYYDIILYNDCGDFENQFIIYEIFKILSPNGYLILTINQDNNNNNINNNNNSNKESLFTNIGFENIQSYNSNDSFICQKPSILSKLNKPKNEIHYDQVIIYGGSGNDQSSKILNNFNMSLLNKYSKSSSSSSPSAIQVSNTKEFNNIIKNNSLIYFIKTIDELKLENFNNISMEYINICQTLIRENLNNCKLILISRNSMKDSTFYLNSSVLGSFKYFSEILSLDLYCLDFDNFSIQSNQILNNIELLTTSSSSSSNKSNNHNQKEFIIRNNIVYYERVKKETNISNKLKSTSFQIINQNNLLAKLNSNLEYELDGKQIELDDYQVEIKVMAVGINFKDNLIYRGLVPPELRNSKGDANNPEFGFECSGIISAIGKNVKEFNIGDHVISMAPNCASTHTYSHVDRVCHKPKNISFVESASMIIVYTTCLHSMFNIGQLDVQQGEDASLSILIHSAAGGIGIAALNILRWKGFKSNIYVTVGSKEKEQYLLDNYGDIITAVYSTRNIDFVEEIKSRGGVDFILNTLGGEFMDHNFKCLSSNCGRVVDLSVTYLNPNEYTDFNKFKYNMVYGAVELTQIPKKMFKKLLVSLSDAISKNQLPPIPIKEYPIKDIKQAIEYINERKHIGKIVVNMNNSNKLLERLISNHSNQFNILKNNYKINDQSLGKTILCTGQTGLILEIIRWVIKYSTTVQDIIILSKSNLRWELELLIKKTLKKSNNQFTFHFKSLDIGDYGSMEKAIDEIKDLSNVDSIFHFAAVYQTDEPLDINIKGLEKSTSAKSVGAINLHNLCIEKGWNLKQFVMASSISRLLGNTGQCCYIASNNVLDALANYRKSIGLPAITVNWGSFETTGEVSKSTNLARFLESKGLDPLSVNTLLGSLDLFIQNCDKCTNVMVVKLNDAIVNSGFPFVNKLDYFTNAIQQKSNSAVYAKEELGVKDKIVQRLSDALSIQVSKINFDIRLIDYGADSLIIVQLKNWLDQNYIPNLFTIGQLQKMTIGNLTQNVVKALNNQNLSYTCKNIVVKKVNDGDDKQENNEKDENTTNSMGSSIYQQNSIEYWKNEIKLNDSIKPKEPIQTYNLEECENLSILLTGATGYLGIYCLVDFIIKDNCKFVYCIVRNKNSTEKAMDAIIENLKYHLLFDQLTKEQLYKIIPVLGDLTEKMFGIPEEQYLELSKSVNLIAHCGADTNFVSPYSETRLTNVLGCEEIIKFACVEEITKKVAYISSFSILMFLKKVENLQMIPSIEHINKVMIGYVQSKIVSEYLFKDAASRGIPTMVLRAPLIFANSKTGIGNTNDIFQLLIQCCYALKSYPLDLINQWNNAPIDWVSKNMVNLMFNNNCWSNSDFTVMESSSSSSTTNHTFMLYNVISTIIPAIEIFTSMENEFSLQPLKFIDWKNKLDQSKQECCIRMNTFHRIFYDQLYFENCVTASQKTIQLLESMNSNFNDSIISIENIKTHLNYHFK